jgi:hypothetical protein
MVYRFLLHFPFGESKSLQKREKPYGHLSQAKITNPFNASKHSTNIFHAKGSEATLSDKKLPTSSRGGELCLYDYLNLS